MSSREVNPNTISRSIIIHWTPSADDPHDLLVAKIPEILKALKKKSTDIETVVLVNTLGTDNFDAFKMNSSDVMGPFAQ